MRARLFDLLPLLLLAGLAPLLMGPEDDGCLVPCYELWEATDQVTDKKTTVSFSVTAGQRYDIILRSTDGDADLYSRDTSPVNLSQWDCRPYLSGSAEEVCSITPTSNGTHYVMVHVYSGPADWNLRVIESDAGCHAGAPGSLSHCSAACTCGYELGDCDGHDECGDGLTCVQDVGGDYGWGSTVDVCR